MSAVTISELEIQIRSDSQAAASGIDNLVASLEKLHRALDVQQELKNFVQQIGKLKDMTASIDAIRAIASSITDIVTATQGFALNNATAQMQEFGRSATDVTSEVINLQEATQLDFDIDTNDLDSIFSNMNRVGNEVSSVVTSINELATLGGKTISLPPIKTKDIIEAKEKITSFKNDIRDLRNYAEQPLAISIDAEGVITATQKLKAIDPAIERTKKLRQQIKEMESQMKSTKDVIGDFTKEFKGVESAETVISGLSYRFRELERTMGEMKASEIIDTQRMARAVLIFSNIQSSIANATTELRQMKTASDINAQTQLYMNQTIKEMGTSIQSGFSEFKRMTAEFKKIEGAKAIISEVTERFYDLQDAAHKLKLEDAIDVDSFMNLRQEIEMFGNSLPNTLLNLQNMAEIQRATANEARRFKEEQDGLKRALGGMSQNITASVTRLNAMKAELSNVVGARYTINGLITTFRELQSAITDTKTSASIASDQVSVLESQFSDLREQLQNVVNQFYNADGSINQFNETIRSSATSGGNFARGFSAAVSAIKTLDSFLMSIIQMIGKLGSMLKEAGAGMTKFGQSAIAVTSVFTKLSASLVALPIMLPHIVNWFGRMSTQQRSLAKNTQQAVHFLARLPGIMRRLIYYRIVSIIMREFIASFRVGIRNLAMYSDDFNRSMSDMVTQSLLIRNTLGSALSPVLQALIPLWVTLTNVVVRASNAVNQFLSAITGRGYWYRAIEYAVDYREEIGKAAAAADNMTASFDELNVISPPGADIPDYSQMFEREDISREISDFAERFMQEWRKVVDWMSSIWDSVWNAFLEGWRRSRDYFIGAWANAIVTVQNLMRNIGDTFALAVDVEGADLFEELIRLVGVFGNIIGGLAFAFNRAWLEGDRGLDFMRQLLRTIRQVIGAIGDIGNSLANALFSESGERFFASLLEMTTNLLSSVEQIAIAFRNVWGEDNRGILFWQSILDLGAEVFDFIGAIGHDVTRVFSTEIGSEFWRSFIDGIIVAIGFVGDIARAMNSVWQEGDQGHRFIRNIVIGFTNIFDMIQNIIRSLGTVWNDDVIGMARGEIIVAQVLNMFNNIWEIIGNISRGISDAWNADIGGLTAGETIWRTILGLVIDVLAQVRDVSVRLREWSEDADYSGVLDTLIDLLQIKSNIISGVVAGIIAIAENFIRAWNEGDRGREIVENLLTIINKIVHAVVEWVNESRLLERTLGIIRSLTGYLSEGERTVNLLKGAFVALVGIKVIGFIYGVGVAIVGLYFKVKKIKTMSTAFISIFPAIGASAVKAFGVVKVALTAVKVKAVAAGIAMKLAFGPLALAVGVAAAGVAAIGVALATVAALATTRPFRPVETEAQRTARRIAEMRDELDEFLNELRDTSKIDAVASDIRELGNNIESVAIQASQGELSPAQMIDFRREIEHLNRLVPEMGLAFDEATGQMNLPQDVIGAWSEMQILQNKIDHAIEARLGLNEEAIKVEAKLAEQLRERTRIEDEWVAEWTHRSKLQGWNIEQTLESAYVQARLAEKLIEVNSEIAASEYVLAGLADAYEEFIDIINDSVLVMQDYENVIGDFKAANEELARTQEEAAQAILDAAKDKEAAFERMGGTLDYFTRQAGNAFSSLSLDVDNFGQSMIDSLNASAKAIRKQGSNMAFLIESGVNDAILEKLKALPGGGAEQMALLRNEIENGVKSPEMITELNKAGYAWAAAPIKAFANTTLASAGMPKEAINEMMNDLSNYMRQNPEFTATFAETGRYAVKELAYAIAGKDSLETAKLSGNDLMLSLAAGVSQGAEHQERIFATAMTGFFRAGIIAFEDEAGIASPSKVMIDAGHNLGDGLIIGINESYIHIANSAKGLAETFMNNFLGSVGMGSFTEANTISTPSSAMITAGVSISRSLIQGISSLQDDVLRTAISLGRSIGDGVVQGTQNAGSNIRQAAQRMADTFTNSFKQAARISSPSRVMADYGVNLGDGLIYGSNSILPNVFNAGQILMDMYVSGVSIDDATATLRAIGVESTSALVDGMSEGRAFAEEVGSLLAMQFADGFADNTVNAWEAAQEKAMGMMDKSFQRYADKTRNAFGTIGQATAVSLADMISNLESNAQAVEDWGEGLAYLVERGLDEGLIEQLREMGPRGATQVRQIIADISDEAEGATLLQGLNEAFETSSRVAMEAMRRELDPAGVAKDVDELFDTIARQIYEDRAMEAALKVQTEAIDALLVELADTIGIRLGEVQDAFGHLSIDAVSVLLEQANQAVLDNKISEALEELATLTEQSLESLADVFADMPIEIIHYVLNETRDMVRQAEISEALGEVGDEIYIEAMDIIETFADMEKEIADSLASATDAPKKAWKPIPNWFNRNVVRPMKDNFNSLSVDITSVFELSSRNIMTLMTNTRDNTQRLWEIMPSWFNSRVIVPLRNHFTSLSRNIVSDMSRAAWDVQNVFQSMTNNISNMIDGLMRQLQSLISAQATAGMNVATAIVPMTLSPLVNFAYNTDDIPSLQAKVTYTEPTTFASQVVAAQSRERSNNERDAQSDILDRLDRFLNIVEDIADNVEDGNSLQEGANVLLQDIRNKPTTSGRMSDRDVANANERGLQQRGANVYGTGAINLGLR